MIKQFLEIPHEPISKPHLISDKNRFLNRYKNIFVYDDNRIILRNSHDNISNDYINASPIDEQFICSQAPLPHEFEQFWLMIWQQDIKYIVMLTKLIEDNKIKAHRYWPSKNNTSQFGKITVTCSNTIKDQEYKIIIHDFTISKKVNQKIIHKNVRHFFFQEWPDHGVPSTTNSVKKLLDYINYNNQKTLIHCSAGIGRSGVFITALLWFKTQQSILDIIRYIRTKRPMMVQTPEQYTFIYELIKTY